MDQQNEAQHDVYTNESQLTEYDNNILDLYSALLCLYMRHFFRNIVALIT